MITPVCERADFFKIRFIAILHLKFGQSKILAEQELPVLGFERRKDKTWVIIKAHSNPGQISEAHLMVVGIEGFFQTS